MSKCKIYACCACKGGCGKSTSAVNIATAFAKEGKRVLLVDNDPQANSTTMMGISYEELHGTLADLISIAIDEAEFMEDVSQYVIRKNGVDVLPSSIMLSSIETKLMNAYGRDYVLKTILDTVRDTYDAIIVDCLPGMGLFVRNALSAADYVLLPTESHYLCYEGLGLILDCIKQIKVKLNPNLKIAGILFTMFQSRTNLCKEIKESVINDYGQEIRIFCDPVPYSIKVAEQALFGKSILDIDPKNPASVSYTKIAEELMKDVC